MTKQFSYEKKEYIFSKENIKIMFVTLLSLFMFSTIYYGFIVITPKFISLSKSFGTEIPKFTVLFYEYYIYFPVLYFLTQMSYVGYFIKVLISGGNKKLFKKITIFNFTTCILIIITSLICLYLPAFYAGNPF